MIEPGVHPTAEIGNPPEWRDWKPTDETFPPRIDHRARVNAFVTVDSGVQAPTIVGAAFVMAHVHIGHDSLIMDGCELAPGAVIGGFCVLEQGVKVGLNACVLPKVRVGEGARIGAGAVVTHDVPPGETWIGNPARSMERQAELAELQAELLDFARAHAEWGRQIAAVV